MPPAIAATEVGRRFAGRWALRGASFDVGEGQTVLVQGANGAGKTTLLRVLASALEPTSGSVRLFGESARSQRARVGLLSHADGHYDDLSGAENLRVAARLGRLPGDAAALLGRVGLAARADDLVRTYSAGMRKRLAFARLLLKSPDLVLLDEPYAALDAEGQGLVDELLAELRARGATVVVSTHQVDRVAPRCDAALVVENGRVTAAVPRAPALAPTGRVSGSPASGADP
ncbi:MAG: heme ABC exporter ATP-binding protein CcmA [Myxococcales bacterium]|nr:heme ABC exporter ATP-binding protein CcmA [Myxococcales bacterium]